jgi:hypothetical protein
MIELILILLLSLMPALFSLWALAQARGNRTRHFDRHLNRRRSSSINAADRLYLRLVETEQSRSSTNPEVSYIKGIGYFIGDLSCKYNAQSKYLRCSVNPFGPCQDCLHHQKISKISNQN